MQAVEADPAHVTGTIRQRLGAHLVDDRSDGGRGVLGERRRDEEAPAGDASVGVAPAFTAGAQVRSTAPSGAAPLGDPTSRIQVARSSRRTCMAASWSRQPTTSTALSSSAL